MIKKSPIKSCALDLILAQLFSKLLNPPMPYIVKVVNNSLSSGIMPDQLKKAMVFPVLKKATLGH